LQNRDRLELGEPVVKTLPPIEDFDFLRASIYSTPQAIVNAAGSTDATEIVIYPFLSEMEDRLILKWAIANNIHLAVEKRTHVGHGENETTCYLVVETGWIKTK
jgi:hypothetical protein